MSGARLDRPRVLMLPGLHNSGPDHWQSHWEVRHGYERVEQSDWNQPKRGDWIARLEEAVIQGEGPVVLVAHSLACALVPAWAAISRAVQRIRAAMLVAPADLDGPACPAEVLHWRPLVRSPLPFPSVAVLSRNDPYMAFERGVQLAADWGAVVRDMGMLGHINSESKLGDWPQGHAILQRLSS